MGMTCLSSHCILLLVHVARGLKYLMEIDSAKFASVAPFKKGLKFNNSSFSKFFFHFLTFFVEKNRLGS